MKRLLIAGMLVMGSLAVGRTMETGVENLGTVVTPVENPYWDVVDQYGNRGHYNFASLKMCQDFLASSGSVWSACVLINPQH